jgi:hypothetical protein
MQSEKDKWIEGVMGSADGLSQAASPRLAEKVMARISLRAMGREAWVDAVMDSATAIKRAAPPDMTDAVLARIGASPRHIILRTSPALAWRIAASVILIALLNTFTIYHYQSNIARAKRQRQMDELSSAFGIDRPDGNDAGSIFFGN